MTLTSIRNQLILIIIGCYLVLNYGIMLLRLPPGGNGIPIGELILIFSICTIHYPSTIPRLNIVFPVLLLCVWWIYVFLRAASGVPEYGIWALRDATNVIESLFIIGGFSFAQRPENIDRLFRWLPRVLIIACIYGSTYIFEKHIHGFSPKISGGSGQFVPLIGTYVTSSVMILWSSFYILVCNLDRYKRTIYYYILSVALVGFSIIAFQARTIYLQIIAIFILFFFYRKDLLSKNIIAVFSCLVIVSLFPLLDFKFSGRLGQNVSIDFLIKHFMAIFGISSSGVEQAASGVTLRTDWWVSIFHRLFDNPLKFLFGLGYGFPLIDFHVTGNIAVREPHNSYISAIARSGVIGLILFIWVHKLLLQAWHSAYKQCKKSSWEQGANQLLLLMVYFVLIWVFAIGEDAFEKPFNAIPYYFFWGIVLRFAYHLKMGTIGPKGTIHQNPTHP